MAKLGRSRAAQDGEPDDIIILDIPLGPFLIKCIINTPFDGQTEVPCYVHFKIGSSNGD